MNGVKTLFYMVMMTVLVVLVGAAFDARFGGGGRFALMALVFAFLMNFFTYWFADTIVLKMHGARVVTPEEAPRLHAIVDRLAARSHMPKPKVCIVPSEVPNAFATGRNPSHSAIAATEGILKLLNDDELEGVLVHELAHVQHYDMLLNTVVAVASGIIAMLASQARWGMIFGGGRDRNSNNPFGAIAMLFVAILAPIFALILRSLVSQQREFSADEGGAHICGNPAALASALRKIEEHVRGMQQLDLGTEGTAHLYFVNHFTLAHAASRLFSTHPPTEERIERLVAMSESGRYDH